MWQESSRSKVCIEVTPRTASYLCCAKGGVWQVVLKPATTHFYKQIRGINLVRFLIEIRASVWGLLGDPRNPTPPAPSRGKKVTSELPYIKYLVPARRVFQRFPEDLLHKPSQVNFFRHLRTRNHILRSIFNPTRREGRRICVYVQCIGINNHEDLVNVI